MPLKVIPNPTRVNASDPPVMVVTAEGVPVALFWDSADAEWYAQAFNDASIPQPERNPMPRDKNGQELHVGDVVLVPFEIMDVPESGFAALSLVSVEPLPGGPPPTLRVPIQANPKQVTLAPAPPG